VGEALVAFGDRSLTKTPKKNFGYVASLGAIRVKG
jgi:hypothetical protein